MICGTKQRHCIVSVRIVCTAAELINAFCVGVPSALIVILNRLYKLVCSAPQLAKTTAASCVELLVQKMASRSLVPCAVASWNSVRLTSLVYFLLLTLGFSSSIEFDVTWTPEGVKMYNSSNPLQVKLGDTFRFNCPSSGLYAHSTVWIQKREDQYKECDCLAGNPGGNCDLIYKNGYCSPPVSTVILILNSNDASLSSFLSFNSGEQYYVVSYTSVLSLGGVASDISYGGQCLQGLKMSFTIAADPTEPVPTYASKGEDTTKEITDFTSDIPPTDVFSGDSGSGPGSNETTTTTEEVLLDILPSQGIQDWHIILIAVLIVIMFFIILAFVAAIVVIRRRSYKLDITQKGDEKKPVEDKVQDEPKIRDDGVKGYPNAVFDDPLDKL